MPPAYECSKELKTYANDIFLAHKKVSSTSSSFSHHLLFSSTHHHGSSYTEQQGGDVRRGGIVWRTQGGPAVIVDDLSGPAHILAF